MMSLHDIEEVRLSIRSEIKRTPLQLSSFLSKLCGGHVYLKLENLQVTNSFKIRGALNKMMHLTEDERQRGVITASTGNHAQAVALSAEKLNLTATIVLPENTPKLKIEKINKYGVDLILHGNDVDLAERYALELSKNEGRTFISPYNDPYVVAGQGTVGLEILEDLPHVNTIIVPVSGGGLLAGIATAAKGTRSDIEILGVQSERAPAMYYSLKEGKVTNVEIRHSVADGLDGNIEQGAITFEIAKNLVREIVLFDEDTIRKAIYLLWHKDQQIAEGAGAIAIAPIIKNSERFSRKRTVAVISGGNIDYALLQDILSSNL
jgi:threonine dehydratase